MQRVSVHISDETRQRIDLAAKAKSKVESEVIREAIDVGLNIIYPKFSSTKGLIKLANMAEKLPSKLNAPRNVSEKHDQYAWGKTPTPNNE